MRVTGKGWKGKLWLTESKYDGATWGKPVETTFTDNDSKFHFGRLPNGKFYYVGIPDTASLCKNAAKCYRFLTMENRY